MHNILKYAIYAQYSNMHNTLNMLFIHNYAQYSNMIFMHNMLFMHNTVIWYLYTVQ